MKIFNGKKTANRILLDLKKKIRKEKIKPKLAVISIGESPDSKLFIRNKKRAAKKVGIGVLEYKFGRRVREKEIIEKIKKLNNNPAINGIIVQLALPKGFHPEKIINIINSQKDIDGFKKDSPFSSPLVSALFLALKKATKNLKGKKILALVNSDIFGKTLKKFLKRKGIKIIYLKDRKSKKIRFSDILITVLGEPKLIKGDMLKKGTILIDAGITIIGTNKVVGDVDRKSVAKIASFLTPVPGGIGPLTIALLLKNVYLANKRYGYGYRKIN